MAPTLRRLADGDRVPTLVVDFLRFTAGVSLADALVKPSGDRPVFRADPVGDLAGADHPSIPDLADAYAKLCRDDPILSVRPPLVVGFCSAAVIATRVAERIDGHGPVVLVQPTWPDESTVRADFDSFRAAWTDEPDGTGIVGDPPTRLRRMMAVLTTDVTAGAAARGLDTPDGRALIGDLLDRYRAWLGFLSATADDLATGADPVVAAQLIGGTDDALDSPWRPESVIGRTRLPVAGDELLSTPDALAAVLCGENRRC